ncbi:hypothetical protein Q1695_007826 [Nippostrongylus brasiliensis]|nr:hypothetical protein Q1695_007826 [Nippostrongylus brasiliensis]
MTHISMVDFTRNTNAVGDVQNNGATETKKKKGISAHMTLINFTKGMIGPGCFSLPLAFRQSGLWTGFALVFIIGLLTCICMAKIVRCSQFLCSRNKNVKSLNYAEMADESFKQSFQCLRSHGHIARRFVNLCLSSLVLGICSIFYIFVVDHTREVISYLWPQVQLSKLSYLFIAILPFLLLSYVRSIRLMSYVSMAGNVFMLLSCVIIFSDLLPAEHVIDQLPWYTDLQGLIMASGAVIYSFEGQALVLPLENRMEYPIEMLGWTGVLSTGMSLVTIVYAACGFFGYITYGNDVKGSITLNMDDSYLNLSVKGLLALVVYTGYLLQLYTLSSSLRASVMRRVEGRFDDKRKAHLIVDYGLRSGIVIVSFLLAVLIPNLEDLIPLVGVTAGMFLALVIPSIVDVTTFLPVYLDEGRYFDTVVLLLNNFFFFFIGIVAVVTGLETNIRHLLR